MFFMSILYNNLLKLIRIGLRKYELIYVCMNELITVSVQQRFKNGFTL